VRYHLIGGQSFFDRREIKDFLAYLKTFVNPHDDISLLRIANVPARGLSDVTMERLLTASHERSGSVFTAMKNPLVTTTFQTSTRESIEAFVEFIERMQGPCSFDALCERGRCRPGRQLPERDRLLRRTAPLGKKSGSRRGRVRKFARIDGHHGRLGQPAPGERLETFWRTSRSTATARKRRKTPATPSRSSPCTRCKGLEFPHVYIVGLEDGLLPHSRSKAEGTLDEERRLFYVAVTRAMQTLTISHCGGRKKYGQLMPCQPSPFLKELPEELVETFRLEIQDARRTGIRKKSFRRDAESHHLTSP
jgi:DNA helicase-2/ATP-dependent DNA helicase PcrA